MKRFLRAFLFIVFISSGFLSFPLPSSSQGDEAWTNLGLYGGQIYDIAIDPSNPDKMFAGSYLGSGLFVTMDGGSSWQAVKAAETIQGEDTFKNHAVWAVKITPGNNNVIWAAHNYWVGKSTDGGQNWTHIMNGEMQSSNYGTCSNCPMWDQFRWCLSLAIDPSDSEGNTVFVGTSGRYSNWTPYGAIYMTEDGGDNWRKLKGPVFDAPGDYTDPEDPGNFDYDVVDLSIDTSNPDVVVLWAVTGNSGTFIEKAGPEDSVADGTLYRGEINRSTGAETWTEIFSMEGGRFYDVEVKPNDPNSIFTANDWGIFRHYFEGGEWKYQWILNFSGAEPPPGAVFARNVSALAFDPKNPDILYAAWKNNISQWENIDTGSKVARGTPPYENANWEIYTADYQFLALTVHPENSEVIFGGELYQGVYKSQDHSQSWTPVNNGINGILVRDVDVDPNDVNHLLAGTLIGVYEKRAAGNWILTSDFENKDVHSVEFDPTDTDGSTYYAGIEKRLVKTTNSGADWTFSDELPNGTVTDIALGPGGNTVFITTRYGGSVYKNENGLATPTLTQVLSSNEFGFNVVVIDPNDPEHIFAGGGNYFGTKVLGNLYESTTGGNAGTWQLTGLTDVIVNALLIDPRDSNIMYAGCGYSGGTDVPVYKSSDRGATWTPSFEGIPDFIMPARAIWGTSPTDIFVVGAVSATSSSPLLFHYDGSAWTDMDSGTIQSLNGVWGGAQDRVFAVGDNGTILYYDGSGWSEMDSGTSDRLLDVWGSAPDNVFAVGNSGTITHYDGNVWTEMDSGSENLLWDVWGTSATDVFAAGNGGTILHYNGETWSYMDSGTTESLWGLWAFSATEAFAVGGNGTIVHYNGSTWSEMDSGITKDLESVWGSSATDVFAVGSGGVIVHYDGNGWTEMDSGTTQYFESVWGSSGTDVFAVDGEGTIVHYDGGSWAVTKPGGKNWNSVTDLEFHRQNKNVVYASTSQQGVYVSPNQAENWLNLGTPEFIVHAISASSLYAGTEGGLLQCTGTGVMAGQVTDNGTPIDNATVFNDFGIKTTSVNGVYMMVCPTGIFDVTVVADGYDNATIENVLVLGADVSWPNFDMDSGVSDPSVIPGPGKIVSTDKGKYCFIATAAYGSSLLEVSASVMAKVFICMCILIFSIVVIRRHKARRKILKKSAHMYAINIMLILIFTVMISSGSSLEAATLFQQVGIASSPNPVGSGARAVGMGGSFIAVADDATAASWNPAGLIQLERPELSLVVDYINRKEEFSSSSRPEISNTGETDYIGINYFSVAYPLNYTNRNMVVSINYQRLYDFERNFDYRLNQSFVDSTGNTVDLSQKTDFSQDGSIGALGLAASVEITPRFSFGLTLNIWTDELFWENGWDQEYSANSEGTITPPAGLPIPYTVDTKIDDKYSRFRGINANLGLLWDVNEYLTVGAVVKTPFTATLQHEYRYESTQTVDNGPPNTTSQSITESVELDMPLSYGAGLAWRTSDAFTMDLDIYRTMWGNYFLTDSQGNSFSPIDGRPKSESNVEDTTQVRIGGEYLFIRQEKNMVIPVRAGFFYDPEPSEGSPEDFYGFAVGSGIAYNQFIFDVAYQFRWGNDVDTGNLISTSKADITQHTFLTSIIFHF